MTKAVSAVIATIMLLMITVSLISVFYVFSSTLAGTTTGSSSQQASQLAAQLSMCMQVDNIYDNQVTLRNCGKGVIENKSLVVTIDDVALVASTNTIQEGNSSVVNISGLWQVPFGKHNLKITNGAAVALALVDVQPNPDGLAGSWNFDEGSGTKAYDNSGNGNVGTLTNMNTTDNATSGWTTGRFGKALQFDGVNDRIELPDNGKLKFNNTDFTVEAWFKLAANYTANTVCKQQPIVAYDDYGWKITATNETRPISVSVYNSSSLSNGISSTTNIFLNRWYNIIFVFSNSSKIMNLFVNGVNESEKSIPSGVIYYGASDQPHIGAITGCGGQDNYFNGTIDEVRIWNKPFAPDETVTMKQLI